MNLLGSNNKFDRKAEKAVNKNDLLQQYCDDADNTVNISNKKVNTEENTAKPYPYDYIGKQFGLLTVVSIKQYNIFGCVYYCDCLCGKKNIVVRRSDLYDGKLDSPLGKFGSCGCKKYELLYNPAISKEAARALAAKEYPYDLIGKKYRLLTVIEVNNVDPWGCSYRCKCLCGNYKTIPRDRLVNGNALSCGCKRYELEFAEQMKYLTDEERNSYPFDFIGKKFYSLRVDSLYTLSGKGCAYLCTCDCGKTRIRAFRSSLERGTMRSCGCLRYQFEDLTGRIFDQLTVLGIDHTVERVPGKFIRYYNCLCTCGETCIKEYRNLKRDAVINCGKCEAKRAVGNIVNGFYILDLDRENYGDNHTRVIVECPICHSSFSVLFSYIKGNHRKSCGLCSYNLAIGKKYGKLTVKEYIPPATSVDIPRFLCKCECGRECTPHTSAVLTGNTRSCGICSTPRSHYEEELHTAFPNFETRNRTIIAPYELDLYDNLHRLAIEIDGTYYHSAECRGNDIAKSLHRFKTVSCRKQDILLIHIFEFEHRDDRIRQKYARYIKYLLNPNITYVDSKEYSILDISSQSNLILKFFLENSLNYNHNCLDNVTALVNRFTLPQFDLCLGCVHENQVIGLMMFNLIDNTTLYITEVSYTLPLVPENSINIFIEYIQNNYSDIHTIYVEVDASKYNENVYIREGFQLIDMTPPQAFWASSGTVYYTAVEGKEKPDNFYTIYNSGYYLLKKEI